MVQLHPFIAFFVAPLGCHMVPVLAAQFHAGSSAEVTEHAVPSSRVASIGATAQLQILQPDSSAKNGGEGGASSDSSHMTSEIRDQVFENTELIMNKPVGDHRQYQHAKLANGLEVVSINDPDSKSAAFAVAVTAGLYYDPPEHYGLAHLTEHSLFLGTERFPERSGFDEFLARHGGSSNAYTAEEATVYYANLNNAGFHEGLTRFADMLRAPLLNQSAIWQEVSAVVSEHSKNMRNPAWYCERVMLTIANPASPIEHFHTGDELTLKNLGPQNITEEIQQYFNRNYCPPRMRLVTFGSDPVHAQLDRANKTFGSIPRLGMAGTCEPKKRIFESPVPFPKERLGKWLLVSGTTNTATLWMLFPLWDLAPWTKSHPMNYVQYLLGYSGKGSLTLLLRDQLGLADAVSISADDSSAGTMAWITAALTPRGVQKPQAVMDVIFTFLQHAKRNCSVAAIKSLAKSSKLMWDWPSYMDASKAASTVAEGMTRLDWQDLLSADELLDEPNQTRVLEVLRRLRPERMNVGIVMPDAEQVWQNDPYANVKTLPHYGVKYNVSTLDDWARGWRNWGAAADTDDDSLAQANANLAERLRAQNVSFSGPISMVMPGVIEGIPANMSLTHATADRGSDFLSRLWGSTPRAVTRNDSVELWFREGWVSPQPWVEASMTLRARRPEVGKAASAHSVVELQVGMHLLADELNQRLADVGYKGFYFSVSETHLGVYVWLGGFTPNLLELTDRMFAEMNSAFDNPDNVSLARTVAGLRTDFSDFSAEAVKTAFTDQKVLLTPRMHSKRELADAITNGPEITYADAKKAVEAARRGPFYATSLVLGNYAEEDAKTLHTRLLDGLGARAGVHAAEVEKVTPVVMPVGPVEIRKTNPREGDQNHVTVVTLLVGPATVQSRVLLGLVGWIYSQVVFAELRTRMELGYVVGGGVSEMSTILTMDCYVQGDKKLPDEVEGQCEKVWAVTVPQQIASLSEPDLMSHKDSFKSSLLEKPLSTNQELTHFEDPILLGGCLGLRHAMIEFLDSVTSRDQLLKAWSDAVTPGNSTQVGVRKKVLVKYFSDGMAVPAAPTADETRQQFRKIGLNGSILERVVKERQLTKVFNEANSTLRESLAAEGGYFPTDLHCAWSAPTTTTDEGKEMPILASTGSDSRTSRDSETTVATIAAGGVKTLMRSEGRSGVVARHLEAEGSSGAVEAAASLRHLTSMAAGASRGHYERPAVRRPPLHPRPASPAAAFPAQTSGGPIGVRRHLSGLSSTGGGSNAGRLRRPPWANTLWDLQQPTASTRAPHLWEADWA